MLCTWSHLLIVYRSHRLAVSNYRYASAVVVEIILYVGNLFIVIIILCRTDMIDDKSISAFCVNPEIIIVNHFVAVRFAVNLALNYGLVIVRIRSLMIS